jgi:hypothetical protein
MSRLDNKRPRKRSESTTLSPLIEAVSLVTIATLAYHSTGDE